MRLKPALNYPVLIPRALRYCTLSSFYSLRCTYSLILSLLTYTRLTCTPSHILTSHTGITRTQTSLSLDDFISSGAITARRRLKRLSLAPYYAAQMKRCTQKWDRRDNQGSSSEAINVSRQLISIVGTGIYHSMANVQYTVGRTGDLF